VRHAAARVVSDGGDEGVGCASVSKCRRRTWRVDDERVRSGWTGGGVVTGGARGLEIGEGPVRLEKKSAMVFCFLCVHY